MKRFWPLALTAAGFFLFVLLGIFDRSVVELGEVFNSALRALIFVMIVIGLTATIFLRSVPVVLRFLSALLLLFVLGVCMFAYGYGRSLRHVAILQGKSELKQARLSLEHDGYITNYTHRSQVWLSSNVVTVADGQYECVLTVRSDRFNGKGTLAMTTNEVFIWLDAEHGPKVIDAKYRPPFFPPRF